AAKTPNPITALGVRTTRFDVSGRIWLTSGLEEHPAELVLLARLEDREHLVAGLKLRRADRDLRPAVAGDGDQPRAMGELQLLDPLAGGRGVLVDLDLDDLEVLLAELAQVDQVVLGNLVLDQRHEADRRRDRCRDAEQV